VNPPKVRRTTKPKPKGYWVTMAERPTADLIVLGLTVVVMLSVFAIVIAMLVAKTLHPEQNVADLAKQVSAFLSSIIAVIVGYIAGRGVNTASPGEQAQQSAQPPEQPKFPSGGTSP